MSEATDRANEALEWLEDNKQELFNISCQRCGSPFTAERYAVAAPPEWFGLLEEQKQLAEDVLRLTDIADRAVDLLTQLYTENGPLPEGHWLMQDARSLDLLKSEEAP